MKLFKTEENLSSIISLIRNAKKFVVVVSPFNNLLGLDELKDAFNEASGKGIEVSYYVRTNEGTNGIEGIHVKLFEVPMLHAKMFFSESEAIVSSGNLFNRADLNLSCLLNSPAEYNDIVNFFNQYIKPVAEPINIGSI